MKNENGCWEDGPLSISNWPAVKPKIPIWRERPWRSHKQWLIFAQSYKRWKVLARCTNHFKWFVIFPKLCSIHLKPFPAFFFLSLLAGSMLSTLHLSLLQVDLYLQTAEARGKKKYNFFQWTKFIKLSCYLFLTVKGHL